MLSPASAACTRDSCVAHAVRSGFAPPLHLSPHQAEHDTPLVSVATHARPREHVVASIHAWRSRRRGVAIAVRGGTADGPGRHTKSFSTQRKRIRSATAPAKKSPPNTPTCEATNKHYRHSNKHHLGVSSTVRDARPTSEHTPSQRQHWLRGGSTNYGTCAKTKIDLSAARDMLAVHAHAPNLASLNRKDRSPSPPPPPPALAPGPWPPPPGPPRRRRRRRRRHRRRRRRLPPPSPSLCTP